MPKGYTFLCQKVYEEDPTTKLKLAKAYHGPFLVVEYHTDSAEWLKHCITGKYMTKPITIQRLKRGLEREELEGRWPEVGQKY